MGTLVEFVVDCPKCGEMSSAGTTMFMGGEPDRPLRIDLEMAAAQMTFTCTDDECGTECYSGDYDVYSDDDESEAE
jgi:hypothetical protein